MSEILEYTGLKFGLALTPNGNQPLDTRIIVKELPTTASDFVDSAAYEGMVITLLSYDENNNPQHQLYILESNLSEILAGSTLKWKKVGNDVTELEENFATKEYVQTEIENAQISGGGSSLDVEDFSDISKNYNLLVAPEGAKYTTIGSLEDGSDSTWVSNLYAQVDQNGETTLNSDTIWCKNFTCNNADIPHTHSNYAPTDHSHNYVATAGSAETAYYAQTAYYAEWADYAVKWNNSAMIRIGNQGRSLNAGDTITLTLNDIGAASTSHEHSDYATTSYVTTEINKIDLGDSNLWKNNQTGEALIIVNEGETQKEILSIDDYTEYIKKQSSLQWDII